MLGDMVDVSNTSLVGPTDSLVTKRLQRWTAIFCIALVVSTWRLWTPQTGFPQVPLFSGLCFAPAWIDWICLGCFLVGLLVLFVASPGRWNTCACLLVLASLPVFVCLDQHRLQPWAYQLWLFTAIWLCCDDKRGLSLMSWLVVSIYFYSALGKFDFEFLHTVGQQMLGAMAKLVGQDSSTIPAPVRLALVAVFPMTELAIAVGLAWPKSRRIAGLLAIVLHFTLIIILGPLGLNHRLGVLIWNALFSVQAFFLFVVKRKLGPDSRIDALQSMRNGHGGLRGLPQTLCCALIAIAIVLPCTERFGIWDHWPSWALYAPHSSRVRVEVAGSSAGRLPTELAALIAQPALPEGEMLDWAIVPIDVWSLRSLDAPIYPQSRFQLGVATILASLVDSESEVRVTILGTASRFTGQRQSQVLEGSAQIDKAGAIYWFNAKPRRLD